MSYLRDPKMNFLLVAVLVDKLGGEVVLTQADIDKIAYNRLEERMTNGVLTLAVVARPMAS